MPLSQQGKGVYSPIFLVPKPSRDLRPVLDLRILNHFIEPKTFKMESVFTIISVLQPGDWLISVDLTDAYLHVPINESHQRYLRFLVGEDHFQFRCLPFGISTAPRVFSKILLAVIAVIRLKGIKIFHYLDDILVVAHSSGELASQREMVLEILSKFGRIINRQKSQLIPSQQMEYLGLFFNTNRDLVLLPERKKAELVACVSSVMKSTSLTARDSMTLLGMFTAASPTIPWARFHTRAFLATFLNQ